MNTSPSVTPLRFYEDSQVDSTNCCTGIIRKGYIIHEESISRHDSMKIIKTSREKGLSITSRSLKRLEPLFLHSLQFKIKSSDDINNNNHEESLEKDENFKDNRPL